MKTSQQRIFLSLYKFQQPLSCLRRLYSDFLSFLHLFLGRAEMILTKKLKTWNKPAALQIWKDGLSVCQTGLYEAWSNKRTRVGVCVGLVALPAWKCYLFFDINARYTDFYYVNYVFYFNTIRAYLTGIFLATGFFIAAPTKWSLRWWTLPVVVFCATEIYQQSNYHHWSDFYNAMPSWQLYTILTVTIVPLFLSLNYLAYRKYHLKDGNIARVHGIIKTPGIDAETKMKYLNELVKESEQFNARI